MKKLIIALILVANSIIGMSQLSVTVDSLRQKGDTLWFSNRKGSIVYLRTLNDTLYFGDATGEKKVSQIGTGTGGIDSIYVAASGTWITDTITKDSVYNSITYEYLVADTTPTIPAILRTGMSFWDSIEHTFTDVLEDGVKMQRGKEMPKYAINLTGSTIDNGRVVYIVNAGGETPRIALADNRNTTSYKLIGMTTSSFANGSTGYVTTSGKVHDLNTSGFVEGSDVYLGITGLYTQTRPTTGHIIKIGTCYYAHSSNGIIDIDIQYLSANGEWNVYNYNGTTGSYIDSNQIIVKNLTDSTRIKPDSGIIFTSNSYWKEGLTHYPMTYDWIPVWDNDSSHFVPSQVKEFATDTIPRLNADTVAASQIILAGDTVKNWTDITGFAGDSSYYSLIAGNEATDYSLMDPAGHHFYSSNVNAHSLDIKRIYSDVHSAYGIQLGGYPDDSLLIYEDDLYTISASSTGMVLKWPNSYVALRNTAAPNGGVSYYSPDGKVFQVDESGNVNIPLGAEYRINGEPISFIDTTINITSSNLLNGDLITLLPAPGSGYAYEIDAIYCAYHYGGTAYVFSSGVNEIHWTANGATNSGTYYYLATNRFTNVYSYCIKMPWNNSGTEQIDENSGVTFQLATYTTGTGTAKIIVRYKIVTL